MKLKKKSEVAERCKNFPQKICGPIALPSMPYSLHANSREFSLQIARSAIALKVAHLKFTVLIAYSIRGK